MQNTVIAKVQSIVLLNRVLFLTLFVSFKVVVLICFVDKDKLNLLKTEP